MSYYLERIVQQYDSICTLQQKVKAQHNIILIQQLIWYGNISFSKILRSLGQTEKLTNKLNNLTEKINQHPQQMPHNIQSILQKIGQLKELDNNTYNAKQLPTIQSIQIANITATYESLNNIAKQIKQIKPSCIISNHTDAEITEIFTLHRDALSKSNNTDKCGIINQFKIYCTEVLDNLSTTINTIKQYAGMYTISDQYKKERSSKIFSSWTNPEEILTITGVRIVDTRTNVDASQYENKEHKTLYFDRINQAGFDLSDIDQTKRCIRTGHASRPFMPTKLYNTLVKKNSSNNTQAQFV